MAALVPCGLKSLIQVGAAPIQENEEDQNHNQTTQLPNEESDFDYSRRSEWLRAAILGANDGLVSVGALMMGVGAVKTDVKAMLLTGFAGSIAGACSMAIGEFVSEYARYEVEIAQMKRDMNMNDGKDMEMQIMEKGNNKLPNPFHAAFASAFTFSIGALVPLLAAAFITDYNIRLMMVVAVATLALIVFGLVGAVLGNTSIIRSCVRVVFAGWIAMAITFGLTKFLASAGLLQIYE